MSNRQNRRAQRRGPAPIAGPAMSVADVLNIANGTMAPPVPTGGPLAAIVDSDGAVLTRAQAADLIVGLASIAYDTLALLGEDERAQIAAVWTQMATDVAFDDIVMTMAEG